MRTHVESDFVKSIKRRCFGKVVKVYCTGDLVGVMEPQLIGHSPRIIKLCNTPN